jgi:hypothetical protein
MPDKRFAAYSVQPRPCAGIVYPVSLHGLPRLSSTREPESAGQPS